MPPGTAAERRPRRASALARPCPEPRRPWAKAGEPRHDQPRETRDAASRRRARRDLHGLRPRDAPRRRRVSPRDRALDDLLRAPLAPGSGPALAGRMAGRRHHHAALAPALGRRPEVEGPHGGPGRSGAGDRRPERPERPRGHRGAGVGAPPRARAGPVRLRRPRPLRLVDPPPRRLRRRRPGRGLPVRGVRVREPRLVGPSAGLVGVGDGDARPMAGGTAPPLRRHGLQRLRGDPGPRRLPAGRARRPRRGRRRRRRQRHLGLRAGPSSAQQRHPRLPADRP